MIKYFWIGSAISSLIVRLLYLIQKYIMVASVKNKDINTEELDNESFLQLQKYNLERLIGYSIHDIVRYLLIIAFIFFLLPIEVYESIEKYIKFEDNFYFKQIFYTITHEILKKKYSSFVSPAKSILKTLTDYAIEALSLSILSFIVIYLIEVLESIGMFKFAIFLIIFAIFYFFRILVRALIEINITKTTKKLDDIELEKKIIDELKSLGFKPDEIYSSPNENFNENMLYENYGYEKHTIGKFVMLISLMTGFKYFYSSDMLQIKLENGTLPTVVIGTFYFLFIDVIISLWVLFVHIKRNMALTFIDSALNKEGKGELFYNSLRVLTTKDGFYLDKLTIWVS
ncbi:hypothetical protein CWI37_0125p0020 [Hamiltosporidium tvaerminnensis]|uniref:Uncharacterized protein n=1 Tax=Hamiltosporidium tvaerminnensis TaxID=1176355 RepID=A0A4Q9LCC8_9MICR|nr:hypothetical protein CWI37_0125p0020 [Hamiltosporidium tvaerminnensis]